MIKLVALDIDGTLLSPDADVDALPQAPITDAVRELHGAGIEVVLATGRMHPGAAYIARHLSISQPLICQQGASVHALDGSLEYGCTIDADIALEVYDYAETHGWDLTWFDSKRYLVTADSPQARSFADLSRVTLEIHPKPHQSGVQATGIDIISDPEHAPTIHRLLEARYGDRTTLLDFSSVTAVHAQNASKGQALHRLTQSLGISSDEVLAVGDSINDVSMLSWAGHSAAPAHCDIYARDTATEILAGDGVDGVAAKLRSVVPD